MLPVLANFFGVALAIFIPKPQQQQQQSQPHQQQSDVTTNELSITWAIVLASMELFGLYFALMGVAYAGSGVIFYCNYIIDFIINSSIK